MSITVLRVQNPEAIFATPIDELFKRAFADEHDRFADPTEAMLWCSQYVADASTALLVTHDGHGVWNGLAILDYTPDLWCPDAMILHFYADAKGVREALMLAVREWLDGLGLSSVLAWNQTGASDRAHKWLARNWATGEVLGSMIRYTVKEG